MSLSHHLKTYKNLDDFHDWPAKYRHWSIEVAEDEAHNLWVSTSDLREIYPHLLPDSTLKELYRSGMFFVKSPKRFYISERAMKLALHKSRTGHVEALKFLDWFDRNIGVVAARKRENKHLDKINEVRAEHNQLVKIGPLPPSHGSVHLDATTVPQDGREQWAKNRDAGHPEKVFRIEALPMTQTWGQFWNEKKARMWAFMISVWHGERNLFLTLAVGVVIGLVPALIDLVLTPYDLDPREEYKRILWGHILFLLLAFPTGIWFAVSVTRSAWRSLSLPGGKLWATTVWLLFIPMAPNYSIGGYDRLLVEEWWATVRGKYAPAHVYVDKAQKRIVIEGSFKYGSSTALAEVLNANPSITLIQIESPGGYVNEGFRMAKLIYDRKMDTLSMSRCASACTLLLQAGQDRYLGPQVRVGFHRSGLRYGPAQIGWSTMDHYIAAYYREQGASNEFIRKALTPPLSGIWIPTHDEMLASGYANARWSDRKPGY